MDLNSVTDCSYLVIGDPIAHSKSPEMQNAGLAKLDLPQKYGKLHLYKQELKEFATWAKDNLLGFNITVPHKESIIEFLDEVDPIAIAAGSCNTVVVENGRLKGYSTDGYGLEMAVFEAFKLTIKGARVLFLGTGGAASAAAFHFANAGVEKLMLVNRTLSKAEDLAIRLKSHFPTVDIEVCSLSDVENLKRIFPDTTLLIQGTSLGLKSDDLAPIDLDLLRFLPKTTPVFDTIYKETKLLEYAKKLGFNTADGRWMLLHQGAKSFEYWTQQAAPIQAMRNALERSLKC